MALAYETGTASDQHDLLDKIRAFLVAQGWTVNLWATDTSSRYNAYRSTAGKRLHVTKDGLFWNFRSAVKAWVIGASNSTSGTNNSVLQAADFYYYSELSGIAFNISTGFNAGVGWDLQPGGPLYTSTGGTSYAGAISPITGTIASYRFFYDDTAKFFLMSVEKAPGHFAHGLLCELEKVGTYTGGSFFLGDSPAGCADKEPVIADYSVVANRKMSGFLCDCGYSQGAQGDQKGGVRVVGEDGYAAGTYADWRVCVAAHPVADGLFACCPICQYISDPSNGELQVFYSAESGILAASPSAFSSIIPMTRVPIYIRRSSTYAASAKHALVGYVPRMRLLRMDSYAAGETITISNESWMVLPMVKKGTVPVGIAINMD